MVDSQSFEEVTRRSSEKIHNSEFYIALVTNHYLMNPTCAIELGVAILEDKPIILLIKDGTQVSSSLKRIAQVCKTFKNSADFERVAIDALKAIVF
jgi:nucleoside 2-deoxyribosyltransferase